MRIFKISVEGREYFIPEEYFPPCVFRPAVEELSDVIVQLYDTMLENGYRYSKFKNIEAPRTFLAFFNFNNAYSWLNLRRKEISQDFHNIVTGSKKSVLYEKTLNGIFSELEKEVFEELKEAGLDIKSRKDLRLLAEDHKIIPVDFTFDYEERKMDYCYRKLNEFNERLVLNPTGEEDRKIHKEIFELYKTVVMAYRNVYISKESYKAFEKEVSLYVAEENLMELLEFRDKAYTFKDEDRSYTFTANEMFEYFVNIQLRDGYTEIPGFFRQFKKDLFSILRFSVLDSNQYPLTMDNLKRRLTKNYKSDVTTHFGYGGDENFESSFDHLIRDVSDIVEKQYTLVQKDA